jgi:hypothetical protein
MADLGQLIVKIGADARAFTKGLNDATNQLNKWSKQAEKGFGPIMDSIGRGLAVVGTAAAAGFGALTVGSVTGASSLEQYRNTLNVVMKDQQKAAETMAWAVDFANRTPFETDSIVAATVKLQSYGLEAQKVLPAIGDMAAVMNKDIMQAVEAVADAQTGELERLKEFGITKAMIVEHGNKIMRGIELVNQKGQIVDQENFNKALLSLMEERFKGGIEIQANSLKGLWSTVVGTFKTTLATMAGISATGEVVVGGLFDRIKTKIKEVIDRLNEWQKSGQLQDWATRAQQAFTTFWSVAEKVFSGIIAFGKFIIDNWGLIGPILAGVLAGFLAYRTVIGVINAVKLAQEGLNLVMKANPIALVITAIGLLVAAGVYLYQHWDEVKAKAQELWKKLADVWDNIKKSIIGKWEEIKKSAESIWDNIKKFLEDNGKTILLLATGPAGWAILLASALAQNWEAIKQTALNIWNSIKTGISGIWNGITDAASGAVSNLCNIVKSILEGLWNYITSIPSRAWRWGRDIIDSLIDGIKSIQIPLPHIGVSWDSFTIAGKTINVPDFDIDWYKDGAIFTGPSVIGVGEAGDEAVIPLDKLEKYLGGGRPIEVVLKLDSAVISRQLVYLNQGRTRGQGHE